MSVGGGFIGNNQYQDGKPVVRIGIDYTKEVWGRPIPLSQGRRAFEGVPIFASEVRVSRKPIDDGHALDVYERDFAIAFGYNLAPSGEHSDPNLIKVWFDEKLVYDASDPSATMPGVEFTFYPGTSTQGIDPVIASAAGTLANANVRLIYLVVKNWHIERGIFLHLIAAGSTGTGHHERQPRPVPAAAGACGVYRWLERQHDHH
jgi:hypothetical protein